MKYVMGEHLITGYLSPVVFSEAVTHLLVAAVLHKEGCQIVSAGFVHKSDGKWFVSNQVSESLKGLGPRKEDELILRLMLDNGLEGLDLVNRVTYERLEKLKSAGFKLARSRKS